MSHRRRALAQSSNNPRAAAAAVPRQEHTKDNHPSPKEQQRPPRAENSVPTTVPARKAAEEDCSLAKCDLRAGVKSDARRKLAILVKAHGTYKVHSVVWMPNWADNHPRKIPTGFAFAVKQGQRVPLVKELFSPDKFFYGTVAVLIPEDIVHKPSGLSVSEWIAAAGTDELVKVLDKAVPDEILDSSGSYAGLYSTHRRAPRDTRRPYRVETWLVVQCGHRAASRELYEKIRIGSADESTWDEVLFSDSTVGDVGSKASRHRRQVAWSILNQLGLEIGDRTLNSFMTIETVSNTFDVDYGTGTYVYYSECTPVSLQSEGGIILGESPLLGPTILRGPDGRSQRRHAWKGPEYYLNAFPSGTGRRVSMIEIEESETEDSEYLDDTKCCWKDKAEFPKHPRLFMGLYRMRDVQFRLMEQKMGYNHAWESLWLKPLAVKLAAVKREKNMLDLI